ncbi:Uncharacterised protein [Mycobacteroides abscessus subsp. abscessus]|nr:Uncharacterised protein [Mycobacteroides abscessus subsp. abscessus]
MPPLPHSSTERACTSTSSTSSPTASEMRAPVEYSSSSSARLRRSSGPSEPPPPAAFSSASTCSTVRLFGSRRLGVGGFTARATSVGASPSMAANRCSPRTAINARAAEDADSSGTPFAGSPRRSVTTKSLTSVSQTSANRSILRSARCCW